MSKSLINFINRKKTALVFFIFLIYIIENYRINSKGVLGKNNLEKEPEITEENNYVTRNLASNCKNILYFSNTFSKADTQLSNLMKKFLAHRELYDNLYSNIREENSNSKDSQDGLQKINKKIKSLVDSYVEKIEDIRNTITKILSEIDRDLSEECKKHLIISKNKVLEHISKALKEIK